MQAGAQASLLREEVRIVRMMLQAANKRGRLLICMGSEA